MAQLHRILFALFISATGLAQVTNDALTAAVTTGFQSESLDWSIGGENAAGEFTNVLSELQWDVSGPRITGQVKCLLRKRIVASLRYGKTFIQNGKVTDTDYASNNRQNITFNENFDANHGSLSSYNFSLGYKVDLTQAISLTPMLGIDQQSQLLFMLGDFGNVQGELRSTYHTRWCSLNAAVQFKIQITKKLTTGLDLSYHISKYSAKANWNLIDAFQHPVSFRHRANGRGILIDPKLSYAISSRVAISVEGMFSAWKTARGKDTLYLADGTEQVTQLNGVNRRSKSVAIGIGYKLK